jgi:Tol biopolymer transport system component
LTNEIGYDGGPFYSRDGRQIVYRAYHPQTEKEKSDYLSLLKQNLIRPTTLELWVMNADGSNKRQVTKNGKANFAPYFFPDGKRIIFASNMDDRRGRNFDLYSINVDGTNLERITDNETFDGFPMFSPDGKKLVFASNRNAKERGETNVFIADWVE